MTRPDWSAYRPTIRVSGGIKAQSARGTIGTTWWSKRFLSVLESLAMGGRLSRGRSYARAGQVLALDLRPGMVAASVQGSRPQPYEVRIGLSTFDQAAWRRIEQALAGQALFAARLLAGDMPQQIEDVFRDVGSALFPTRAADLAMSCSCPDWSVPCKHLAATFYLLAEAFDTDPFQILLWRGRSREELLASLRALRGAPDPASPTQARVMSAAVALDEVRTPALVETVDRFWVPPVPLSRQPPTVDVGADLLLRQLGTPPPEAGGATLAAHLREVYVALRSAGSDSG